MSERKGGVLKGLKWSLIDQFGIYVLKLIFGIAIARLLTPGDYGIVGIIAIFIAIGRQLTDSGFQMALVQKKDADEKDYNTVFVFNLVASIIVYFILYFSAKPIADIYGLPQLVNIIRISSLNIPIGTLSGVQMVVLMKHLDFKTQAKINFISTVISGILGFVLALNGFGFWSLVIQTLSGTVARSCMYWFIAHWIPSLTFSFDSFKSLFRFGSKLLGQGLIDNFFTNIYNPLIGKFYSIGELGFYSKAKSFTDLYIVQISVAVTRVAFPAFSNINTDANALKSNYKFAISVLTVFFFGVTLFLYPLIHPAVILFLTKKWSHLIPLMQLLILEAFFFPLYRLNMVFLEAQGKSGTTFMIDLVKKLIMFTALFFTITHGVEAIIYGFLFSSAISFFSTWFFLADFFQIKDQLKLFGINVFFAISVFLVTKTVEQLPIGSIIGPFIKSVVSLVLFFICIRFPLFEPFRLARDFVFKVRKSAP